MTATKRTKPEAGQLVAIPLKDGTFGLGHLASGDKYTATIVLFPARADSVDELANTENGDPISVIEATAGEIEKGRWPVFGKKTPKYGKKTLDTHGESYTYGRVPEFLEAFHGLTKWNAMGPGDDDELLLPGVKRPKPSAKKNGAKKADAKKADAKKESAKKAPAKKGSPAAKEPKSAKRSASAPVAKVPPAPKSKEAPPKPSEPEGPGEIHIIIRYPGNDLPTVELVRRRNALEARLEERGAGEVVESGGGEGIMDVYLETKDLKRALELTKIYLGEAGFAGDATIEIEGGDDD